MTATSATTHLPIPLTGAEKRALRARAQLLDAVVRVGHAGVTDAVVASLDEALLQHGLVKVRFAEFKEQRDELASQLAQRTTSHLVSRWAMWRCFSGHKSL